MGRRLEEGIPPGGRVWKVRWRGAREGREE